MCGTLNGATSVQSAFIQAFRSVGVWPLRGWNGTQAVPYDRYERCGYSSDLEILDFFQKRRKMSFTFGYTYVMIARLAMAG